MFPAQLRPSDAANGRFVQVRRAWQPLSSPLLQTRLNQARKGGQGYEA